MSVSTLWTCPLFRSLTVGPCSHGDEFPAGFAESVWSPPALEGKLALSFHQQPRSIKHNGSESRLAAQSCHMTSWGTTGSVSLLRLLSYWDRWAGYWTGRTRSESCTGWSRVIVPLECSWQKGRHTMYCTVQPVFKQKNLILCLLLDCQAHICIY